MGIVLRGTQIKKAADLGTIYHKFQQLGPGHDAEVKAWVVGLQQELMALVARGEDLDGQAARKAGMLTELYNKATVMAHIFWEKFPQPDYLLTIGTEIKHTMEWEGLTLSGTIDKLLQDTKSGLNCGWIRDHKSTGRSLESFFGGLAWSVQPRLYRILAKDYAAKNNIDITFRGFILDGITFPGIKQCGKDEKNAKAWGCPVEEAYLRRVKEWYRDFEVKADLAGKSAKAIDSKAMFYTEPMYPVELLQQMNDLKQLATRAIDPALYSRDITRRSCFQYERQCKYHDLCTTDPAQWDRLFETRYKLAEREYEPERD